MNTCPICGDFVRSTGNGEYKCPSCGYVGGASNEFAATTAMSAKSNVSGEAVFDENINAVLEVICPNDSTVGSGFIINKAGGYALTNAHVIIGGGGAPASKVYCLVAGDQSEVEVLAYGDMNGGDDLALLHLKRVPYGAKEVKLGDSSAIKNGARVYVIGNSKGDGTSITSGIVSDRARRSGNHTQIMTDAAINPGNSGGPMFNERGELVGVVVSKRNQAEGMGYAIPVNQAKEFIMNAERKLGRRIL